eukprot:3795644-Amphidinium_carterae.1
MVKEGLEHTCSKKTNTKVKVLYLSVLCGCGIASLPEFKAWPLADNEMAKTHGRHLVGAGHVYVIPDHSTLVNYVPCPSHAQLTNI